MLWVVLAALFALPTAANELPDSTRVHLQSLEAAAARLEREGNTGRQYEKVKEEIARIRREYRLGGGTSALPATPPAKAAATAAAAGEELRSRQKFSRFYETRGTWQYAYSSHLQFAQKPIQAGGLGFDYVEADSWARRMLEAQPPEAIAAFRRRYEKALAYVRLAPEEGGMGYGSIQARNAAFEHAKKSSDAQLDKWIAENRQRILSERGGLARFKGTCRAWYKAFE